MNLKDLIVSDATEVLLNVDELADSIQFISSDGQVSTVVVVVDWMPSVQETRANHRVLIEPVTVSAESSLAPTSGSAVRLDDDRPFDFVGINSNSGGMVVARFERTTILDTGTEGEL